MPEVTETSPFPGAQTVYRRTMKLLEWMGANGHIEVHKKKGKPVGCTPSAEMNEIIEALSKANEAKLKATLLDPRYFDVVHASV